MATPSAPEQLASGKEQLAIVMSISDRKGSNFFWTRVLERSAKYEKMCDIRRKIDGLEDNGSLIELENGR